MRLKSRKKVFVYIQQADSQFNLSLANVPILYPLKTPENPWFSGVFRRYKMRTLARNGLKFCAR